MIGVIRVGTSGADHIDGTPFDDTLSGLGGHDTLHGGEGADALDGGLGLDTASYAGAIARVVLDLRSGGRGGDADGDVFWSIENVIGSDHNDYIFGNSANNVLSGGDGDDHLRGHNGDDTIFGGNGADDLVGGNGNDQLFGGADNDTLHGGRGVDVLDGGQGVDTVSYAGARGRVIFDLRSQGWDGDAEDDTYISIENAIGTDHNDLIFGSNADNILVGGAGNDMLRGHNGNDTIIGGAGADDLNGGAGADVFVFSVGHGNDELNDFQDDIDVIQFSAFPFSDPADAMSYADQVGRNVVFDFGNGDILTVENATMSQLLNDVEIL